MSVLRGIVQHRRSGPDPRCAALLALAKRDGATQSDLFAACLNDPDEAVRIYARIALACVGDARAWEQVFDWLDGHLATITITHPGGLVAGALTVQSKTLTAVCYLARHLDAGGTDAQQQVIRLLQQRWDRLYRAEQEWLAVWWPDCTPGATPSGIGPPTPADIAVWISDPLLRPLHPAA